MECEPKSTSTMMNINTFSGEIVKEEEQIEVFSSEELHASSIITDYGVSANVEKTDIQIVNTSSTSIVVSEVIENEQIGGSNSSQNLIPSNQINVIYENENKDNKDEKAATVTPALSTEVKMIGSLGLLSQYASSSDETDDTEDEDSNSDRTDGPQDSEKIKNKTDSLTKNILDNAIYQGGYRGANIDTSDSDTDDSDIEYVTDERMQTIDITNDAELHEFLENCENNIPQGPIKAKGELRVEDLPPIEELSITVAESDCVQLGTLHSVVDTLVLIESLPNFAALDIDTVLFLEAGNRTLGQVFDVMGNVASPIYCVRFNCADDIKRKDLAIGMKVYVAPQTKYTNFIVLSHIMKQKGCDASWENDNEVPEDCNEFSDDEKERLVRRKKAQNQRNQNRISESDVQLPDKIQIKNEPSTSNNCSRRKNWPRNKRTFNNPARFYKDNRGYNNNRRGDYNQHKVSSNDSWHSWHTVAMHKIMPLQTRIPALLQQENHPKPTSNYYPNPFALQMNYNQFNQQAFPPLPPPMPYEQPKKK